MIFIYYYIMHTTLINEVKGYVDNVYKTNAYIIEGWCFHLFYGVCNSRVRYDVLNESNECIEKVIYNNANDVSNDRADVNNAYNGILKDNIRCGWKFTITDENPININLELYFESKWSTVFKFTKLRIENSQSASHSSFITIPEGGDLNLQKSNNHGAAHEITNFSCKRISGYIPSFVVVDNFYDDVDSIRKFALSLDFVYHPDYHKGKRTDAVYRFDGLKESFESILHCKIKNWTKYGVNGCFQYCIGGDQLVYHQDFQEYAGIIFLTPDAPPQTGTSFHRSKHTNKMKTTNDDFSIVFNKGFLDPTEFEVVDVVGNVYNRLVLFDAQQIHAASNYFGNTLDNGRLFQLFFFDLEK